MIINELLCYTIYCQGSNAILNLSNKIDKFYDDEEVVCAKKALWEECEQTLGEFQTRVYSKHRPAKVANIADILEAIKTLDTLNKLPDAVARNLDRVPDRQPEELTILAAFQRIDKLEKAKEMQECDMKHLTVAFMELRDNVAKIPVTNKNTTDISEPGTETPTHDPAADGIPVTIPAIIITPADTPVGTGEVPVDSRQPIDRTETVPVPVDGTVVPTLTDPHAEESDERNIPGGSNVPSGVAPNGGAIINGSDTPIDMAPWGAPWGPGHGRRGSSGLGRGAPVGIAPWGAPWSPGQGRGRGAAAAHVDRPPTGRGSFGRLPPSHLGRRHGSGHRIPRGQMPLHRKKRRSVPTSNMRSRGARVDEDGFTLVQSRRPRSGLSRAAGAAIAGAPPPNRHIWVSRVMNGDSNGMKRYLTDNNVTVLDITKTSHDSARYISFKILIPKPDLSKVFNNEFWPDGIKCRMWFDRSHNNVNDNDENNDGYWSFSDDESN